MNTEPTTGALPPAERESFFDAQRRHRRTAMLWSVAAAAVAAAIAFAIALLLAPLLWSVVGLVADLLHLAMPMPDVLGAVGARITTLIDGKLTDPAALATLALVAALPGFAVLGLLFLRLRRLAGATRHEAVRDAVGARAPRRDDLEEIQFANLVEEMAIAARVPPPRVALIDHDACNVGILGDGEHAAVIATRGVLDRLARDPTQALIGQAIAALGNGDGALAERMLRTIETIRLMMLLSQAAISASARRALVPLLRRRPDDAAAATLKRLLGDPWQMQLDDDPQRKPDWRDYVIMPLAGSLIVGVIVVPIATIVLLAPLLGVLWRRRRLLADATAVQFTRNPEALAQAYAALANVATQLPLAAPWLVNLFVLDPMAPGLRIASPYPRLDRRVERLRAMGATVAVPMLAERGKTLILWLLTPLWLLLLALLAAAVTLGCWVSLALNMLFLGLPVGALHLLLRWAAGS